MCGRYRLRRHWEQICRATCVSSSTRSTSRTLHADARAARKRRPTDADADRPLSTTIATLTAELRRWGFIIQVDGKTIDKTTGQPKKLRRDVINAMSEKLTSSYMWKWSFKERRCLIPMSSWDEWPRDRRRQATRAGLNARRASVRGSRTLYDANVDPEDRDVKVEVYTMCTVPPNEFLGHRARPRSDGLAAVPVSGVAGRRRRCPVAGGHPPRHRGVCRHPGLAAKQATIVRPRAAFSRLGS